MPIQTRSLQLVPLTIDEVRAMVEALGPEEKAQLSADWLAQLHASSEADMWAHGFRMEQRESGAAVGMCGFKAPPSADGVVEISYGVDAEHRGKGYATEAAEGLVNFAFESGRVRLVLAHTLAETNASTRVLTKCGFRCVGEVIDPEDGSVWRWEKEVEGRESRV